MKYCHFFFFRPAALFSCLKVNGALQFKKKKKNLAEILEDILLLQEKVYSIINLLFSQSV